MATHGHHGSIPDQKSLRGNEWRSMRMLLPYLLEFRGRVALALVFLVSAKLANVSVPLAMKGIVDSLTAGLD
ncbi:MAG: metal ABC transporter permease, partial [Burkholderiales bacterium]|nr:metal ABC transporter permease [Burkholderiales bacterium]